MNRVASIERVRWPQERSAEAWSVLAETAGVHGEPQVSPLRPGPVADPLETARDLGLDAERVAAPASRAARLVRTAAPCLVRSGGSWFAVLAADRRAATLLGPGGGVERVPLDGWIRGVRREERTDASNALRTVLRETLPHDRGMRVAERLERGPAAGRTFDSVWRLRRRRSGRRSIVDAWRAIAPSRIATVLGLHAAGFALGIVSWWVLGRSVFAGALQPGWWVAWALLWFTTIPLRHVTAWKEETIKVDVGAEMRRLWMDAALAIDPRRIAQLGPGQLTTRTVEAESLEDRLIDGASAVAFGSVELIFIAPLALYTAGGVPLFVAFVSAAAASIGAVAWLHGAERRRMAARLAVTDERVERMQGHRTALVADPACGDDAADRSIERYLRSSRDADRKQAVVLVGLPSLWLLLAVVFAGLGGALGASAGAVAGALGIAILGHRTLGAWIRGWEQLSLARIAWEQLETLRSEPATEETSAVGVDDGDGDGDGAELEVSVDRSRSLGREGPWIFAKGLDCRREKRSTPLVENQDLRVEREEQVMLSGISGSGKSTLLSTLAGLRPPDAGVLRVGGEDARTLTERGWSRRTALAPQFERNHVFQGTLAFNLLMGRGWPPSERDLEEAEALCRELGLGEVLDRMPRGIHQPVGETGWQLSHGERSRLFVARALLQGAEAVLLDESLGTLDPATARSVMDCVRRRAGTLVISAHD